MKQSYSEKLRDPRWQKKRLEILELAKFTCKLCGSTTKELHVHHGFYESGKSPWDYPAWALHCLCVDCHYQVTERTKMMSNEIANVDAEVSEIAYGLLVTLQYVKSNLPPNMTFSKIALVAMALPFMFEEGSEVWCKQKC